MRRSRLSLSLLCCLAPLGVDAQQQPPAFRSSVELLAVEAQVVDDDGQAVPALGAADFEVSIDGRQRPVRFAQFVSFDRSLTASPAGPGGGDARVSHSRIYILAVDEASFRAGEAQMAGQASRGFIELLHPSDYVGLFTFPVSKPEMQITQSHAAVKAALNKLVGGYQRMQREFDLLPSEVVDLTGQDRTVLEEVVRRECRPFDRECPRRVLSQAMDEAAFAEAGAGMRLSAIANLLTALERVPGRKTVVVVSAGLLDADRVGGRPDLSGAMDLIADAAARSNTVLYVLHHRSSSPSALDGGPRRLAARGDTPLIARASRDGRLRALGLEQVAGVTGGLYQEIEAGTPAQAFARIMRESAGFYVLAVETTDAERDGQAHHLRIDVDVDDATVRNQSRIVIPRHAGG